MDYTPEDLELISETEKYMRNEATCGICGGTGRVFPAPSVSSEPCEHCGGCGKVRLNSGRTVIFITGSEER